ncbi:GlcG/HbpS family heme-binding protein [Enterovirga sp. CN4-39]|uniref:GlcG/HbpS family heme-binding protein n=1 Tax=Enterovirga sp. CN4-39 TaxID=3400910 RepID=UPI003BFB96E0
MPIVKHTIDEKTAKRMIKAAVAKSEELKKKMCIAITNEAGQLKAFLAMDGAAHLSIGIAQDKAYTASAFGIATHVWWDFVKNDPPLLHGITHTPRLTIFGGGYPIRIDDEMIGAIGVSGGHYSEDMEVARAALSAVEADIT